MSGEPGVMSSERHRRNEDRQRQHRADPEAPRHVAQLLGRAGVGSDDDGFEGHAADGAGAGSVLTDLGVHRARVLDLVGARGGRSRLAPCEQPAQAEAGSEFMLNGAGYTPDKLVLQRGNNDPVEIELDLGDADPFEIPIGSRAGDEGLWRATVSNADCEASATFRVTLKNTDMIDDLMASPAGGIPPIVYLAVILGGFGLGAIGARRLRLAA